MQESKWAKEYRTLPFSPEFKIQRLNVGGDSFSSSKRSEISWIEQLTEHIVGYPGLFPVTQDLTPPQINSLLSAEVAYLDELSSTLSLLYGTPDLGNKTDPLDELIYIVLSRRTKENAYQKSFRDLKERFLSWDQLLYGKRDELKILIQGGGLVRRKIDCLLGALSLIKESFGTCTLDPLNGWSNLQVENFLCSLPEISRKSAYCIMLYALGRQVFPVDTHVGRTLTRLGIYQSLGLVLAGKNHKQLQSILANLIPPELRYSLHVNLIQHGRHRCRAMNPRCKECEIRGLCRGMQSFPGK